jgi:hypothetical protein
VEDPGRQNAQVGRDWYYCQYHKYNDPESSKPYFRAWVTYKSTGEHYWESFYYKSSPSH